MKIYLYNPSNGAPIKNWFDGTNFWKLEIDEIAAFPVNVGSRLKETYGFLQEVSIEQFDGYLAKLDKEVVAKVKVGDEGGLIPKEEEEIKEDKKTLEVKKEEAKKMKAKIKSAKEAVPVKLNYWEMPRGALLNECNKRGIEVRVAKGVYVSKEDLIHLLENDDKNA